MKRPCQYDGCKLEAEDNREFCIFHSPSPKDIEEFKQALASQINEEGPEEDRNEPYSFDGYVFPGGITSSHSRKDLIRLPQTIEGNASFRDATIYGDVRFDGATIKGNARFDGATIVGDAWFLKATIYGAVRFDGATIVGAAWFFGAKIEGEAYFFGAKIEGLAFFDDCSCASLFISLNGPRIRGWGSERCGINITYPSAAVSFWRFAQRIYAKTGKREKADAAFYFERLNHWRDLRRIKAYKGVPRRSRIWRNWVLRPGYWILFLLDLVFMRWTTAYGASVARLFSTWFVVIGGFGITFSMAPRLIGRASIPSIWSLRNWIIGLHYSVTTFATLGLGDVKPGGSRLGMFLTSVEAILGALLIALAVLVIGRRFMRQG